MDAVSIWKSRCGHGGHPGSGGPDDQPRYSADSSIYVESFTYTLEDGRMTGSGEMQDHNFVVLEFDEVVAFTFEASCS